MTRAPSTVVAPAPPAATVDATRPACIAGTSAAFAARRRVASIARWAHTCAVPALLGLRGGAR